MIQKLDVGEGNHVITDLNKKICYKVCQDRIVEVEKCGKEGNWQCG